MTLLLRRFLSQNWLLLITMLALTSVGIWAIWCATHFRTDMPSYQGLWRQQLMYAVIGLVGYLAASLVDYKWIKWGALPCFLLGVAGLVAVQLFGREINHNKSWIFIGGRSVQPSQFAILAGIIMLSFVLGELHKYHRFFQHPTVRLGLASLVVGIPLMFVLKEGDLGSALVWIPVAVSVLLVGSIPLRYLLSLGLVGLTLLPLMFFFGLKDYQQKRVTTPIRMLKNLKVDSQKEAYALTNIVNAIGSSGFEGKGLGGKNLPIDPTTGQQKKTSHHLGLIPKDTAHNDYLFAVWAEEQGFRGSLLLLIGYMFLLLQCWFIAICARDQVGRLLVVGIMALVFGHVFENVGMQIQLMPSTGIPLPFFSYGGTFLVVLLFAMGLVQSVWIHRNISLTAEGATKREKSKTYTDPRSNRA
jgi:rod shape determining protein RodA